MKSHFARLSGKHPLVSPEIPFMEKNAVHVPVENFTVQTLQAVYVLYSCQCSLCMTLYGTFM